MLRWCLLLGTFAIWIGCMLLVYNHSKVRQTGKAGGNAMYLDALFDESAEMERGWRIFVDLRKKEEKDAGKGTSILLAGWLGVEETKLKQVGWLKTTNKRRGSESGRIEQLTEAEISVPSDADAGLFKLFSPLKYKNRSQISFEQGLDSFDAEFQMANTFTVVSHGIREADTLVITQQILQQQNKLMPDQQQRIPLPDRGSPTLDLTPFQPNRAVVVGAQWDISMLDTSAIDLTAASPPRILSLKAKCTGKREIYYNNARVPAYEVVTSDGQARAWYSADGMVLKQACRIAGSLDVLVVRILPEELPKLSTYIAPAAQKRGATKK
ncbi:MAG TPA: hypothetical protein VGP72_04755 [Planctomycetota bacterium]|jgi:hypothetical protein